MPTKMTNRLATYTNPVPQSLVTSKWSPPIEGFTPHPQYARPLTIGNQENLDQLVQEAESKLEVSEVLLAHETTPTAAQDILSHGFQTDKQGSSAIRDNAVFGWLHKSDIGYFQDDECSEATHLVLFAAPRCHVFVSSYESSAKQLMLGELTRSEYEEKHVLVYNDYEHLQWNSPSAVKHLHYNSESLLPSR